MKLDLGLAGLIVAMVGIVLTATGILMIHTWSYRLRHEPPRSVDRASAVSAPAVSEIVPAVAPAVIRPTKKTRPRWTEEQELNAPSWPRSKWNGHFTLYRGVWVDDFVTKPSNGELDRFRDEYWRTHRVVTYTLVEGEQEAPLGENGKVIRVRVTASAPGGVYEESGALLRIIPCISVQPVDATEGQWARGFTGTLPAKMSHVERVQ